jgi:hypothetical protein
MIPFGPNQTLDGGYFSRANQNGGGQCNGSRGILQPTGSTMNVGGKDGQMKSFLVTGGRA